jgi:hypothetical protein
MSAFFGHVADAALPVAVALLVLTAVARGVLWARIEGDEQRIARQHLEPLATWCLIASGIYVFAICAAGEAGVLPIVAAIALAAAAIAMRHDQTETAAVKADEPEPDVRRSPAPETLGPETGGRRAFPVPTHGRTPAPTPTPTPSRSLWDEPTGDTKRPGLWAR